MSFLESSESSRLFIEYALRMFKELNWKAAKPEDCDRPDIIAWGNVNEHGFGCVCVIDPQAQLFKIEQTYRSGNELLSSKCIVHYTDVKIAISRFEHYMDVTGAFYKEGWLNA